MIMLILARIVCFTSFLRVLNYVFCRAACQHMYLAAGFFSPQEMKPILLCKSYRASYRPPAVHLAIHIFTQLDLLQILPRTFHFERYELS